MKRPNTIANKNIHNTVGLKLNLEKDAPFSSGTMGVGGLGNTLEKHNDKQVNHKNMNDIYDMLQKYAGHPGEEEHQQQFQGKPPVISKENIVFNGGKQSQSLNNSPPPSHQNPGYGNLVH